jgi:hypothetical protein
MNIHLQQQLFDQLSPRKWELATPSHIAVADCREVLQRFNLFMLKGVVSVLTGFAVKVAADNKYWPAGTPPESQEDEVRNYVVLLNCHPNHVVDLAARGDNVTLEPPYRGYVTSPSAAITYWHAYVSEALLVSHYVMIAFFLCPRSLFGTPSSY